MSGSIAYVLPRTRSAEVGDFYPRQINNLAVLIGAVAKLQVLAAEGKVLVPTPHAKKIIAAIVPKIPLAADWPEHSSLDNALVTDKKLWPPETVEKLRAILNRFL